MAIKTNLDTAKLTPYTREYPLPSKGLPYRDAYPDFPDTLVVSPYSFETEGILTTNLLYYDKLAAIAGRVVANFPAGFAPADLVVGDLVAIMTVARALTYGESYKFSTVCPACEHKENHTVKVPDDLPLKSWDFPTKEALVKASSVTLPHCRDKVEFGYLTLGQERDVTLAIEATRKGMSDQSLAATGAGNKQLVRAAARITGVNGTVGSQQEIIAYLRRIQGKDMVELRRAMNAAECGISFAWDVKCESCGHVFPTEMDTSLEFFRGFDR